MISRLRPLNVEVSFQDRTYKLGEAIDVDIEVIPNRDCHVREGRVDLVLEERWTERSTLTMDKPIYQRTIGGVQGGGSVVQIGTETVTKQVNKDHKEASVQSSVLLLEDERLMSGAGLRRQVRLKIGPDPPPHAGEGKTSWWLQTVIDVAGARDVKPRRKVKVSA